MDTPHSNDSTFLRRQLLLRGGIGLGALALGGRAFAGSDASRTPDASANELEQLFASSCTLTPSDVQGPFWLDLALLRQDITEGVTGIPLTLFIKVVDAATCAPIPGAVVDVWHADPDGRYSGFVSEGTGGSTVLRGIQIADADGIVEFHTIYPGWYTGRTPHFHVKVRPSVGLELTTQLYMADSLSSRVYLRPPYDFRGQSPVTNTTDAFFDADLLAGHRLDQSGPRRLIIGKRIALQ